MFNINTQSASLFLVKFHKIYFRAENYSHTRICFENRTEEEKKKNDINTEIV